GSGEAQRFAATADELPERRPAGDVDGERVRAELLDVTDVDAEELCQDVEVGRGRGGATRLPPGVGGLGRADDRSHRGLGQPTSSPFVAKSPCEGWRLLLVVAVGGCGP